VVATWPRPRVDFKARADYGDETAGQLKLRDKRCASVVLVERLSITTMSSQVTPDRALA
jgi:hypothetical protein